MAIAVLTKPRVVLSAGSRPTVDSAFFVLRSLEVGVTELGEVLDELPDGWRCHVHTRGREVPADLVWVARNGARRLGPIDAAAPIRPRLGGSTNRQSSPRALRPSQHAPSSAAISSCPWPFPSSRRACGRMTACSCDDRGTVLHVAGTQCALSPTGGTRRHPGTATMRACGQTWAGACWVVLRVSKGRVRRPAL
jgi:hypothetical protein